MLISLLTLGFLMGVRHALEADHVAAVASLATRASSSRETARLAALWGAGHAAMLLLVGGLVVALGAAVPEGVARVLEGAAGALLVVLGVDVLRRLRRRQVHFHVHRHDGGVHHLHAHAHAGDAAHAHDPERHHHEHPTGLFLRALLVGSMHGMAGSAALVVLSLRAVSSTAGALAYIAVFGLGAVAGMVLFSLAIALPLRLRGRHLDRVSRGLEAALGAASVTIGAWIVVRSGLGF
ncbi:MAG TPA: urease accessory protein [Vicinamibacteria bacterium]|nr:urease accessory protein [Vicinamibacteria bacterium]